jgi:hypothetical protein
MLDGVGTSGRQDQAIHILMRLPHTDGLGDGIFEQAIEIGLGHFIVLPVGATGRACACWVKERKEVAAGCENLM